MARSSNKNGRTAAATDAGQEQPNVREYESTGLEDFLSLHKKLYCGLNLRNSVERYEKFRVRFRRIEFPALSVNIETYSQNLRFGLRAEDTDDFYAINIPLTGLMFIENKDHSAVIRPGGASVSSMSFTKQMNYLTSYYKQLVIKIGREDLEYYLSGLIGQRIRRRIRFGLNVDLKSSRLANWTSILAFALRESKNPHSALLIRAGAVSMEQLLVTGFIVGQPNNYTRYIDDGMRSIAPSCVRKAESFMMENAQVAITLRDVSTVAGVSVSALYYAFQKFRNSSPMAYLQNVRLEKAHEDVIKSRARGESIGEIARRWSFNNAGRFARIYRQRYGHNPSQTR